MNLSIRLEKEIPVLRVEGDVDPDDARILETAAWDAFGRQGTRLVLDFQDCTYVSSAGLAVLFSLARWARSKGGIIAVARPRPEVLDLLRMVGLIGEGAFRVIAGVEEVGG